MAAAAFIGIFFLALPFPLIVVGGGVDRLSRRASVAGPTRTCRKDRKRAAACRTAGGKSPLRRSSALLRGGRRSRSPRSSLGPHHVLVSIGTFFSKLAVVSFGGAYALLAYMAQEAVET